MAGTQLFSSSDPYGSTVAPVGGNVPSAVGSHTAFIVWLLILGVILPAAIIGGLKVGGYSFVFRGR